MKPKRDDLAAAQRALARATEAATRDYWSKAAQKKVEECRRAVVRARKKLEQGGQATLDLGAEDHPAVPEAFR